mgnify:CR=1 FL=1
MVGKDELNPAQRKALSDFADMIAAAWFTAGIISPFFTKPKSAGEIIIFLLTGLLMTWVSLRWSLSLLEDLR